MRGEARSATKGSEDAPSFEFDLTSHPLFPPSSMAPRARKAQVVLSSDSDDASTSSDDNKSDSTAPTPPPPKRASSGPTGKSKQPLKHVSLPSAPSPDASIMNNDQQEKQNRRRQSGNANDISLASAAGGADSPGAGGGGPLRRVVQGEKKRRLSAINGADKSAGGGDLAPVVKESVEVMETKFEEWMKLATDNVSSLLPSFPSSRTCLLLHPGYLGLNYVLSTLPDC